VRYRAVAAEPLEPQSTAFPAGGFYVLRSRHAHVVVDCGDVGFGGRGGHGHNDILSFELFFNGFNVVTDCGAYLYTASREWRNRFRSTAFHNTVEADGEELNRFIAPDALWQLRFDARPVDASLTRGDRLDVFSGGHTGYARLAQPISHTRRIAVDKMQPRVLVHDRIGGEGRHELVWRFHIDPAVTTDIDGFDVRLSRGDACVWLRLAESADSLSLALEEGWVSTGYGVKSAAKVVVWKGTVSVPMEASFLFADARIGRDDWVLAADALAVPSLG
jgi:uncharacterized heparinase superfamily protein